MNAIKLLVSVTLVVLLSGCVASTTVREDAAPRALSPALLERKDPGPFNTSTTAGSFDSSYGCRVDFEIHEPVTMENSPADLNMEQVPSVILAHGFMDSMSGTRGWAQLWASHGVRTAVATFCNSNAFNGHHQRNAEDLIVLADIVETHTSGSESILYSREFIYAGFSAGGLSALLAAAADERAIGYLGLDPVDSGNLADRAILYSGPSLLLFGEPSSCNANNNMVPKLTGRDSELALTVSFATHCDFRSPYTEACERLCGRVVPGKVAVDIRDGVAVLATSWIVGLTTRPEWLLALGAPSLDLLERSGRIRIIASEATAPPGD